MSGVTIKIGDKVGDWIVLCKGEDYVSPKSQARLLRYVCQCKCGKEKLVRESSLKDGDSKGCGCRRDEEFAARVTKHGHSRHELYGVWYDMIRRCSDKSRKDFKHYGGRGIRVAAQWQGESGFKQFIDDMYESYSYPLELERVDVNGDYCPQNCTWVSRRQQVINRRPAGTKFDTKFLEYNGKTLCISEWAEEYKLPNKVLVDRLGKLQWGIHKALTTPVRYKRYRLSYEDISLPLSAVFENYKTVAVRASILKVKIGDYAAKVFEGTVFDVQGQSDGEWINISPLTELDIEGYNQKFSNAFIKVLQERGLEV